MECNLISHSNKYFLLSVFSVMAFSANVPSVCAALGDEQFILQQQRQQALEEQLTPPVPDVRLSAPTTASGEITFPDETPCFRINHVTLRGQAALPHWLPLQKLADRAVGKCLGSRGINLLMSSLQNRLKAAQLIEEIGSQAMDVARTEGQIRATNAGKAELERKGVKELEKGASKEAYAEYNRKLTASDNYKTA
jgi:hypothetical protein